MFNNEKSNLLMLTTLSCYKIVTACCKMYKLFLTNFKHHLFPKLNLAKIQEIYKCIKTICRILYGYWEFYL